MKSDPATSRGTRKYDASRRQDDARARRRRVVESARDLFLERGYGVVTIQEIARAADVSPQMVYAAFGSKAGILTEAVNTAITGDDEAIALYERPDMLAVLASDDPRTFAAAIGAAAREVHGRSAAILNLVDTVSGSDPEVEELRRMYEAQRRSDADLILDALPRRGMRTDIDLNEAKDVMDYVGRGSGYIALVVEAGWTPERYEAWMAELLLRVFYDDV